MAKAKPIPKKKVAKKKAEPKRSVGRPTKYSSDVIKKVHKYIDDCEDEVREVLVGYSRMGSEMYKEKLIVHLPSIEGLSLELDVCVDTITEWRKTYPEFSAVIKKLLAKQAKVLLEKGISGDYNAVISKVLLTKHGYREGIESTGANGGAIEVDVNEKKHIENLLDDVL